MGRGPRVQFEGALNHVYTRGNHREPIAYTDQDYRILERYFIEAAHRTGAIPRAWNPMTNHFHAMVETPLGNIAEFMQSWMARYARYFNRVYKKVGHLFQGRYGSRLVDKDAYQKELIRYIDLQRHRVKDPESVDRLGERYASRRFYMGETCPPEIWPWIEPMLKLFGEDIDQARKNYAQFLADGLKDGNWQDFYKPNQHVLGNDQFLNLVQEHERQRQCRPSLPDWQRKELFAKLLKVASELFTVNGDQLRSPLQRRDISSIRQAMVYVGRQMGLRVTEMALELGRKPSAIGAMIRAVGEKPSKFVASLQARMRDEP